MNNIRQRIHLSLVTLLLLCSGSLNSAYAAQSEQATIFYDSNKEVAIQAELFEFDSEQQRQQAIALAKQLRCPQCQNQNLVESNSPVAKDLRLRVYQMIREGQSEQEIVAFMTDRFGEFVRYAPVLSKNTYLLWFTPLLLLVIGFIWAILLVKRQRR